MSGKRRDEVGSWPDSRPNFREMEGEEINTFPILFKNFCLIRFQENLKTFFEIRNNHSKIIAALMLKHVSKP